MRLSDIMSHAGLAGYAEVGLVLFLFAFVLIVVRLWLRRDRDHAERMSRMPLDDEPRAPAPSNLNGHRGAQP